MRRGEERGGEGGNRGDDTGVKQKVPDPRTGALWFGIAADVKCDLTVTLPHRQQSFCPPPTPPSQTEASPAACCPRSGPRSGKEVVMVWCRIFGLWRHSRVVYCNTQDRNVWIILCLGGLGGVLCMQIPLFLLE